LNTKYVIIPYYFRTCGERGMHLLMKALKLDHIHLTDVDGYIAIDHCRAV